MKHLLAVPVLASLFISGCSLFNSDGEQLMVSCIATDKNVTPTITVNDKSAVAGEYPFYVRRGYDALVSCKADGHKESVYLVETGINTTGILDIIGSVLFIAPILSFTSDGIYSLDTNDVVIYLEGDTKK